MALQWKTYFIEGKQGAMQRIGKQKIRIKSSPPILFYQSELQSQTEDKIYFRIDGFLFLLSPGEILCWFALVPHQ